MSLRARLVSVLLLGLSLTVLGVQAATLADETGGDATSPLTHWNDDDVSAPVTRAAQADPVGSPVAAAPPPGGAAVTRPRAGSEVGQPLPATRLGGRSASGAGAPVSSSPTHARSTVADLRPWAQSLASRVSVPDVALEAYGAAELRLAQERPACHLSWVAVAGIGSIESNHGRHGGALLRPDGTATRRVVGVALDGAGVARVSDTDGGALDGDRTSDHAVGPMQFIPSTWSRWAADADADGRADPFSLPDAALAAGRYLCAAGEGDLRAPGPWSRAVWAYNHSDSYVAEVTRRSNAYATASRPRVG